MTTHGIHSLPSFSPLTQLMRPLTSDQRKGFKKAHIKVDYGPAHGHVAGSRKGHQSVETFVQGSLTNKYVAGSATNKQGKKQKPKHHMQRQERAHTPTQDSVNSWSPSPSPTKSPTLSPSNLDGLLHAAAASVAGGGGGAKKKSRTKPLPTNPYERNPHSDDYTKRVKKRKQHHVNPYARKPPVESTIASSDSDDGSSMRAKKRKKLRVILEDSHSEEDDRKPAARTGASNKSELQSNLDPESESSRQKTAKKTGTAMTKPSANTKPASTKIAPKTLPAAKPAPTKDAPKIHPRKTAARDATPKTTPRRTSPRKPAERTPPTNSSSRKSVPNEITQSDEEFIHNLLSQCVPPLTPGNIAYTEKRKDLHKIVHFLNGADVRLVKRSDLLRQHLLQLTELSGGELRKRVAELTSKPQTKNLNEKRAAVFKEQMIPHGGLPE